MQSNDNHLPIVLFYYENDDNTSFNATKIMVPSHMLQSLDLLQRIDDTPVCTAAFNKMCDKLPRRKNSHYQRVPYRLFCQITGRPEVYVVNQKYINMHTK